MPTLPTLPTTFSVSRPVPTGTTWTVNAGGDLQAAIDSALPGDEIVVQYGATWAGSDYRIPPKTGGGWILFRSSSTMLPASGTRVVPVVDAAKMPRLRALDVSTILKVLPNVTRWWFEGIELDVDPSRKNATQYGIVQLGYNPNDPSGNGNISDVSTVPDYIVFSHCYIHGHTDVTVNCQRGILANANHFVCVDSYIDQIHWIGTDDQAIAITNAPGPFQIVNNTLISRSENLLLGGDQPAIAGCVPSDIEIRGNYLYKYPSWVGVMSVKNHFETKNSQRGLFEGNICENNWASGQTGHSWVLWPAPSTQTDLWSLCNDWTLRKNIVRNVGAGILMTKGYLFGYVPTTPTTRMLIEDNIFTGINESPYLGDDKLMTENGSEVQDMTFRNNTCESDCGNSFFLAGTPARSGYSITNNIFIRNQPFGSNVIARENGLPVDGFFAPPFTTTPPNAVIPDEGPDYLVYFPGTQFYASVAAAETAGFGADRAAVLAATGSTGTGTPFSPLATITSPSSGAVVTGGTSVSLQGTGVDDEDGALTGASLRWTSNLDGLLGTGSPLATSSLSVGAHTITLRATDTNSNFDEDSITLTVLAATIQVATLTVPVTSSSSFSAKADKVGAVAF